MIIENGVVTGRKIAKNQDGQFNVRLLQVRITDPEDIQTIEFVSQAGQDSSPPNGSRVIIITIGTTKFAVAAHDLPDPEALPGEKLLYSTDTDGEDKEAELSLRTNGDIEINGDNDFAVRFNDLKTILDQLVVDINAQFTAIGSVVPAYTPVPIVMDLTAARVDNVKLPA